MEIGQRLNLSVQCRLCGNFGNHRFEIFDSSSGQTSSTWSEQIFRCLNIRVIPSDLTLVICNECTGKLRDYDIFRDICHQTNIRINGVVNDVTSDVTDVKHAAVIESVSLVDSNSEPELAAVEMEVDILGRLANNCYGKNSLVTEHQPMDESTENMSDRQGSHDCAASSLVKTAAMNEQYFAKANLSIRMEMDTNESNAQPLKKLELMDVNDDCLRVIFKQLSILDQVSVADVCKRFRLIAQENFGRAKPTVSIPEDICRRNSENKYEAADKDKIIQTAARSLRNFGSSMTELKVESGCSLMTSRIPDPGQEPGVIMIPYDEKIVALIIKYCSQDHLIALKLFLTQMKKLPIGLEPIFRSLKKLDYYSRDEIDASVTKWLTIVEDLTLDTWAEEQDDALLKCSLPNLQRVSIGSIGIDSIELRMFFKMHKKIKEIHIERLNGVDNHKLILPVKIEKMSLQIDDQTFDYLKVRSFRNLKNLKSLELIYESLPMNYMVRIIREIVAGNIRLKHLTLTHFDLTWDLCDVVSKLICSDTLTLNLIHLFDVDLIENRSFMLHRLSELHLDWNMTIPTLDPGTYIYSRSR